MIIFWIEMHSNADSFPSWVFTSDTCRYPNVATGDFSHERPALAWAYSPVGFTGRHFCEPKEKCRVVGAVREPPSGKISQIFEKCRPLNRLGEGSGLLGNPPQDCENENTALLSKCKKAAEVTPVALVPALG